MICAIQCQYRIKGLLFSWGKRVVGVYTVVYCISMVEVDFRALKSRLLSLPFTHTFKRALMMKSEACDTHEMRWLRQRRFRE